MLTTVGVQLGVLDLRALYLDFPSVFKRFQIWRLLTNFCFVGGFGFPFVMRIMMMCVSPSLCRARRPPRARTRRSRVSTETRFAARRCQIKSSVTRPNRDASTSAHRAHRVSSPM